MLDSERTTRPGRERRVLSIARIGGCGIEIREAVTRVIVHTFVRASVERCFDLARDVETHCLTSNFTNERVVPPGRMSGLLGKGDLVTFEGSHFGLRLRLTVVITECHRPVRFIDEGINGPFKRFRHVHQFHPKADATMMIDTLEWELPYAAISRMVDRLILQTHLSHYLRRKQDALKRLAEHP